MSDLCLLLRGSATENVEIAVEPLIDLFMNFIVVVTDLLRRLALLACFCLSSSAILVSTANIYRVVSSKTAEPCIDVCGEDAPNNVAKMRHVIDVRQRTRDQDVALSLLW